MSRTRPATTTSAAGPADRADRPTPATTPAGPAGPWSGRVEAAGWDTVRADLDAYGCALAGQLLDAHEAAEIAALYPDDTRFRSTVNMGRYRFGDGEY